MYDHVIVGAGSAGCVLAGRLSGDPGLKVLLLEAGPPDRKTEIRVPAAFTKLFKTPFDWDFATEPQRQLNGRRLYWPRGKTLGGSSSINAQMYVRGCRADYDGWARLGNPGWGWDDVLPVFRRMEGFSDGAVAALGRGGPQRISRLRGPNPLTAVFLEACGQAGIPLQADVNGPVQEGVTQTLVTQRRGARWSAADAYLKPAVSRPNLEVLTGALATRVRFDGARAIGVDYVRDGVERVAEATGEVILAGGAVNSPQLLMLSGVGEADVLRDLGIEVVRDLPAVGRSLRDHLAVGVIVSVRRPITLVAAESLGNLVRYLLFRKGMLASNVAEAYGFIRSGDAASVPDLELIFAPVPFTGHGLEKQTRHGVTIGVVLQRPRSTGSITLASADPGDAPLIDPAYLSDRDGADLATLIAGIRTARRVFAAAAFAPEVGEEIDPGSAVETDQEVAAFIRARAETLYHPVGTCRMGSDADAVVDPELRVRGLERLRVVDASVMPQIIRGHTNAPTMMIAERAADLIRSR